MIAFWGLVASNAVVATALAIVAALLARVWKNAAAIHLLWVVVLLKLFTPPVVTVGLPSILAGLPTAGDFVSPVRVNDQPRTLEARRAGPVAVTTKPQNAIAGSNSPSTPSKPITAKNRPSAWSLPVLLASLWLCGSCGMAILYAAGIRRFSKIMREFEAAPPDIRLIVAEVSDRLRLGRVPEVLMTSRALPPLVWSIGNAPRVILPSKLFARLGLEAQTAIIAHELAHIRRGDHLVRLLELAATTVFWWHPVAWLAGRRLRDLEEECCDARVLDLLPDRPRTYAAALVDTLEFLSGATPTPFPLRTAIDSTTSLSRRIMMLTQRRTTRLSASSAVLVAGLALVPLTVAFAGGQEPAGKAAPAAQPPAGAPGAVLKGRVTTKAGDPLPGVRVLVVVPAADMRFVDPSTDHTRFEAKSDANGNYQVKLPGITKSTKISIDAMLPGFRRLVGTLMMGGDDRRLDIEPGATAEASFSLEPARYFSGVVVDEQGQPIPSVRVGAMQIIGRGTGGVEITATGPDGSFEIFNYLLDPASKFGEEAGKGFVSFSHSNYIESRIEDVYAIAPEKRGELKIILPSGRKIAGTVLDVAGHPVANAMVEVNSEGNGDRKATLTDASGSFSLRGLKGGPAKLTALAFPIKQKARLPLKLDVDKDDLEVRLQAIPFPSDIKKYAVLGMQLAEVTPVLKDAYDLYWDRGALILDPGKDFERLAIGDLSEGYLFWMVGNKRIGSVREFVDDLLAEAGGPDATGASIRVVYSFKTTEMVGTNTQYIKLTKDDIKQLQAVSDQLKAEVK